MFQPDDLGMDVFRRSYAFEDTETWEQASKRVANHVAAAEDPAKIGKYSQRFYDEIVSNRFMPGGRIWYGSGRPKAQLLNCFVIPISDSREGWGDFLRESLIISGTGGGVGTNFTPVRPYGTPVKGTGGIATGPVSVMRMDNAVGHELVAGGGRRMAKMFALDVTHPDIMEFLDAKLVDGTLSNANISIIINMDVEDFKEKIMKGEDLELKWGGPEVRGTVNARELWKRIVQNAWENGEPGVLNGDLANKMNNLHYLTNLVCTNPCGEIWLERYGCCCLGAMVLPRFVDDSGKFDYESFDHSIRSGVRFLDDVLTVNQYPLDKIKDNCENVRRIGLGVMGLHSMLLKMGHKYDSKVSFDLVDHLMGFMKHTAYDESIMLAGEKGPFPAFDEAMLDSGFMKTMKPAIRRKIKEHGIRNCALMTVAPTGTTGMVCGVTTGIEPLMAPVYWRRMVKDVEKNYERVLVIEPEFDLYPDIVQGAADISVDSHFRMQAVVQKHVDNAVSKTINLPTDYQQGDLAVHWLRYLPVLKGTTFYRWGSRENEPFVPVPMDQVTLTIAEAIRAGDTIHHKRRTEVAPVDCATGVCEVPGALTLRFRRITETA
jgi:ribonucleoside-diphosphate reductase alpha chain